MTLVKSLIEIFYVVKWAVVRSRGKGGQLQSELSSQRQIAHSGPQRALHNHGEEIAPDIITAFTPLDLAAVLLSFSKYAQALLLAESLISKLASAGPLNSYKYRIGTFPQVWR